MESVSHQSVAPLVTRVCLCVCHCREEQRNVNKLYKEFMSKHFPEQAADVIPDLPVEGNADEESGRSTPILVCSPAMSWSGFGL